MIFELVLYNPVINQISIIAMTDLLYAGYLLGDFELSESWVELGFLN